MKLNFIAFDEFFDVLLMAPANLFETYLTDIC